MLLHYLQLAQHIDYQHDSSDICAKSHCSIGLLKDSTGRVCTKGNELPSAYVHTHVKPGDSNGLLKVKSQ